MEHALQGYAHGLVAQIDQVAELARVELGVADEVAEIRRSLKRLREQHKETKGERND